MLSLFRVSRTRRAKARKRPTTRRATIERLEERTVFSDGDRNNVNQLVQR